MFMDRTKSYFRWTNLQMWQTIVSVDRVSRCESNHQSQDNHLILSENSCNKRQKLCMNIFKDSKPYISKFWHKPTDVPIWSDIDALKAKNEKYVRRRTLSLGYSFRFTQYLLPFFHFVMSRQWQLHYFSI